MRKFLLIANCFLLACFLCYNLPAQTANGRLTSNGSFSDGLNGWNNVTANVDLKTRSWWGNRDFRALSTYDFELGVDYALIRGDNAGYLGQVGRVPSDSRHHLLNCHAYKRSSDGVGPGGYAAVAVSYYDASWNEVDKVEIPIGGPRTTELQGEGDGLSFISYGLVPPSNAEWFMILVYTSAGTEVLVDSFELFHYEEEFTVPETQSIVANSAFRIGNVGNRSLQSFGLEYWNSFISPSKQFPFEAGDFGALDQDEFSYQFIPVDANQVYVLETTGNGTIDTSASVGIDFYDANWVPLGKRIINFRRKDNVNEFRRVVPPVGTVHSSVWAYCAQSDIGDTMNVFRLSLKLLQARTDSGTAAIVTQTGWFFPKAGSANRFVSLVLSDRDGVDLSTVLPTAFCFPSINDPSVRYGVRDFTVTPYDQDRAVLVRFSAAASAFDAKRLVIKANKIKDQQGNPMAVVSFPNFEDL